MTVVANDDNVSSHNVINRGDPYPPYPYSWYAVGFAKELKPGRILTRRFLDDEIVIFQTESGVLAAVEPYCPHLGAHIGRRGRVEKETVVCPFHEFKFAASGQCVSTPCGEPPRGASLTTLPVRVHLGMIMVYHGPAGQSPAFDLDLPESDPDWHPIATRRLHFNTHPQEVNENGLDHQHFATIHKFTNFVIPKPMEIDGARLYTEYGGTKPVPIIGGVPFHFTSVLIGLGFSLVELTIARLWMVRQMVLATPVAPRKSDIYIGVAARRRFRNRVLRALMSPIERLTGWLYLQIVTYEVTRDQLIWDDKIYYEHPKLIPADGPIGKYRRWVRQFYPPKSRDGQR
ncbi:Rieske (2Fe-2S) protein [Mycobacterium koreense]|uniref:cholesterol 7-desaturase n=1 Tax=Mycolicibacillus koreensis TaxID=1069220 RepID=A0A7I7SAF0_9MYCO|nr:Rieske 2Fe-2S domain-containing protein [Mycolicibacillus koreensis]MCV7249265.1 Rieske (2Fe-2S) protein [Mycolicibacillus koreensis]OSC35584.1 hypothetical protein B8W67_02365 [Mycolicibacillus koreensis]BBY53176.1 (2Fe-2S)-binding protein [Mycolicibacillus koreensis]